MSARATSISAADEWPCRRSQEGYPPHDHPMREYRTGEEIGSCGGPLSPPEEAHAKLDAACKCGRLVSEHHAAGDKCPGLRFAPGGLYCGKCRTFVVASDDQIARARAASRAWFRPPSAPLVAPPDKTPRPKLDPSKVTLNMFDGLPQYHAKLRPNGTAR